MKQLLWFCLIAILAGGFPSDGEASLLSPLRWKQQEQLAPHLSVCPAPPITAAEANFTDPFSYKIDAFIRDWTLPSHDPFFFPSSPLASFGRSTETAPSSTRMSQSMASASTSKPVRALGIATRNAEEFERKAIAAIPSDSRSFEAFQSIELTDKRTGDAEVAQTLWRTEVETSVSQTEEGLRSSQAEFAAFKPIDLQANEGKAVSEQVAESPSAGHWLVDQRIHLIVAGFALFTLVIYLSAALRPIAPHEIALLPGVFGGMQQLHGPRLIWLVWPFTRVIRVNKGLQQQTFQYLSPIARDGHRLTLSAQLNFRVADAELSCQLGRDVEAFLRAAIEPTINMVVGALNLDEVVSRQKDVGKQFTKQIQQSLEPFGIAALSLNIACFHRCRTRALGRGVNWFDELVSPHQSAVAEPITTNDKLPPIHPMRNVNDA